MRIRVFGRRIDGIVRPALLQDKILAVHLVMPGAAVKVVAAHKIQATAAPFIHNGVEGIRFLIQVKPAVCSLVKAGAVVRAFHVRAHVELLIGQHVPMHIGVRSNGNDRGLL